MKLKLSDWASIAEIVSGIAVVVTLIFLVLEVRQGNSVTRASMYASFVDSLIENRERRLEDTEFNELYVSFITEAMSDLSDSDLRLMVAHFQNIFQIYEKAYFTREYDLLGDAEWSRFERQICVADRTLRSNDPATELELVGFVRNVLTFEFIEYVDDLCATEGS